MTEVIEFANKGGYVFGVCNGFQILCESGLVEGTLQHNNNQKFVCKNVHLRTETSDSLVTRSIDKGAVLNVPIAHGEGKFFAPSDVLKGIEDNDQVLFRYCDENGQITDDANPNGSINNIAGICNSNRNVFGMMPHPERAADPNLKNEDGKKLFESILNEVLV
jgi:phosphoribosylformylglycinamidine synthase